MADGGYVVAGPRPSMVAASQETPRSRAFVVDILVSCYFPSICGTTGGLRAGIWEDFTASPPTLRPGRLRVSLVRLTWTRPG